MEQVRTLNIRGSRETLQAALVGDSANESLREPLQAIAGELVIRSGKVPTSVYICSADADADLRNYFAFVAARAMQSRVPNLIVVDCDFLSVGLSKIVPERDALGFLDLLLYGSSLDVITQKTADGVPVIGAGSFPVSRKSPFVMDAFEETVRYLSNHARCVLFCGPVLDDDNQIHPILGGVNLRILVRSGKPQRPNTLDAVEEQVVAAGGETWVVRVAEPREPVAWQKPRAEERGGADDKHPAATTEVATAPESVIPPEPVAKSSAAGEPKRGSKETTAQRWARGKAREPVRKSPEKPREATVRDDEPPPQWDEVREVAIDRRSGSSLFPRIIIGALGVLLIGFVAWWLYLTRSIRDQVDAPFDMPQMEVSESMSDDAGAGGTEGDVVGDGTALEGDATALSAAPDPTATPETSAGDGGDVADKPAVSPPPQQEQTVATPRAEPPPAASTPTGVSLREELAAYAGEYLIHVSSFRRKDLAQSDADYFDGRGYETIVARVDLGDKGLWYRVYVGPFTTRDEAQAMKIRLDENPRVRSTRITKVPG